MHQDQIVEEEIKNGCRGLIVLDLCGGNDIDCPIAYQMEGGARVIVATFERHSTLTDHHPWDEPSHAVAWAADNGFDALPLIKYEHGLVAYAVHRSYPFNCPWDSGQVGLVLVKRDAWDDEKSQRESVDAVLDELTNWCNGSIYGYVIEDENGDDVDSCWGYIGLSDYLRDEMREHLAHEAQEAAKRAEAAKIASARALEAERADMYPPQA